MKRRRAKAMQLGLFPGRGRGRPRRPRVEVFARPPRPGVYGMSDPDRVRCQEVVRPRGHRRPRRQCRFYARDVVRGLPLCRRHGRARRAALEGAADLAVELAEADA